MSRFPALVLALAACAAGDPAPRSLAALAGGEWIAVAIDGEPLPPGAKPPTAAFADGRVAGFAGCNRYGGPARETAPGAIALGPLAATKMACPGTATAIEDRYLAALATVARFAIEDGELVLSGAAGATAHSVRFTRR